MRLHQKLSACLVLVVIAAVCWISLALAQTDGRRIEPADHRRCRAGGVRRLDDNWGSLTGPTGASTEACLANYTARNQCHSLVQGAGA